MESQLQKRKRDERKVASAKRNHCDTINKHQNLRNSKLACLKRMCKRETADDILQNNVFHHCYCYYAHTCSTIAIAIMGSAERRASARRHDSTINSACTHCVMPRECLNSTLMRGNVSLLAGGGREQGGGGGKQHLFVFYVAQP